jgi:hypothetical protein
LAVGDPLKDSDELAQYREIVAGEIRNHRLFSRITLLTGVGLIGLGIVIAISSPDLSALGYLLLFVGFLRFLNTFYDLQREDRLKKSVRRIEERFGRRETRLS